MPTPQPSPTINRKALLLFLREEQRALYKELRALGRSAPSASAVLLSGAGLAVSVALGTLDKVRRAVERL